MPAKQHQPRKKSPHRRARKGRQPLGAQMGSSIGFPKEKVVKMRYVSYAVLTSNGASMGVYKFRANSIFDPDETGAGHQPYTSDQWAQFYNHYQVLGSKIKVSATVQDNLTEPAMMGVYLSDDTTIPLDWETLRESGRGDQVIIPKYLTSNIKLLTTKFSSKGFFGDKHGTSETMASVLANPTEMAYYNIYLQSVDQISTITNNVICQITIDYIVKYSEPKDLASS